MDVNKILKMIYEMEEEKRLKIKYPNYLSVREIFFKIFLYQFLSLKIIIIILLYHKSNLNLIKPK